MKQQNLHAERQKALPLFYEGIKLEVGCRVDFMVEDAVIVEIKVVDSFNDVHKAQILTYLKMSGCRIRLLLNFNVAHLKQGIKRLIL